MPKQLELDIEGMTCTACARRIEKNLNKVEGVSAYVDFASERAHLTISGDTTEADIAKVVEDAGYAVGSNRSEIETLKWRVLVGSLISLPVAVTSMVHAWMWPMWVYAVLVAPVALWVAWPFHLAAFKNLRHKATTMDTLVSLGVLVAFGYSLYQLAIGRHEAYFEVAAVVPTVVLIGRWLEVRTRRSATDSVRALLSAIPETAKVRTNEGQQEISTSKVAIGDLVVVAMGERIPVDGIVVEGAGSIDNSLITGESVPERVTEGSLVAAGAMNLSGSIVIETTAVSSSSRISRIADLVREATATKTKITSLTDRVSAIFVPTVIAIALLTFAVWFAVGETPERAVSAAIAVLVIACPCALGIAVPMSLAVATANGAKRGIVIRNPDALSTLSKVDTIVLDKTGTLTTGNLRVLVTTALAGVNVQRAIAAASALERGSNHPIAKAIASLDSSLNATAVRDEAGVGVTGMVEGAKFSLGIQEVTNYKNAAEVKAALAEVEGMSVAILSHDNAALLVIGLADDVRAAAKQLVESLKALKIDVAILSGDVESRVESVASDLGVENFYSRVTPEQKLQHLAALEYAGKTTAMVGDGLNDVAALAGASVGIAMGSGTHAAQSAAAITILDDSPLAIAYALKLSRKTWANIRENLAWAFGYNIVLIPVAALGLLNPMLAGAAMAFSSISVVLNSLRLRRQS
jgi:Cu+-exporting ATPase